MRAHLRTVLCSAVAVACAAAATAEFAGATAASELRGATPTAASQCLRLGTTVKAAPQARLFLRERRLYGCLKPRGRVWFIWDGRNWADPVGSLRQLRLAGRYFAGVLPWVEGVFGGELIGRTNLATGVSRTTAPITTAAMEYPLVQTLILAPGGGVAWGARSSLRSTIRCWGRRAHVHVLDADPSADGRSLRLAGSRLTWMRGATRRSAAMC